MRTRTVILFTALYAALIALVSCSGGKKAAGGDPEPPAPPTPAVQEKTKMLWFDAEANFRLFSRKENISYYLDKAKSVGFNKIVVDVRPVQGDVLYKSDFMTPLTGFGDGYTVDRDWDYLQFFLDEAHKRDLKVTVSTTIFTAGMPSRRSGMAYRDDTWNGKTCMEYKPGGMMDVKDDTGQVTAFLNPVLPEVQEFALKFIREIVTKYDFDSYALDYCRFPDAASDFSDASRKAFEKYIGKEVENFPSDIFTYNGSGARVAGPYYRQWWEFRSMVIRDFVARVRTEIHKIKPGATLEYWAASWWGALYEKGQNWGSKTYDPSNEYPLWASENYKNTGFADQLDVFLLGTYLNDIYGLNNPESIEYGIKRAKGIVKDACTMYGTIYALNHKTNIDDAVYVCLMQTAGLMVFDIVQVIGFDEWDLIKEGIDRAEKELAEKGK